MDQWRLKDDSVNMKGTYEQHTLINHFMSAATIFANLQIAVITSANDARHMAGSKHFEDKALDFRVWGIGPQARWAIVTYLNHYYQDEDWVDEEDHIHGEVDPE
jgi:hypothetical protein